MKTANNTTQKWNVYSHINDFVIEGMKKLDNPMTWFMPWSSSAGPCNYETGRVYKGINEFWLNNVCRFEGYEYNEWLTAKCAYKLGGKIKKDDEGKNVRSHEIFLWKVSYIDTLAKKGQKKFYTEQELIKAGFKPSNKRFKVSFFLRYYNVYNISQIDGLEPKKWGINESVKANTSEENIELAKYAALDYLTREKIELTHVENSAYYRPSTDSVNMPKMESFIDKDSYFKTLFHELGHSTGAEKRLNRAGITKGGTAFGDNTYAFEELIAEITSMYCVGELNLDPKDSKDNSLAYLKGWAKKVADEVKENDKYIITAMTQASKAVNLILNK